MLDATAYSLHWDTTNAPIYNTVQGLLFYASVGSMMTMVFQRGAPEQRSRTQENDLALMISHSEKQLLFYQRTGYRSKVKFPLEKILSHSSVRIHYDLQETALFICCPQVHLFIPDTSICITYVFTGTTAIL